MFSTLLLNATCEVNIQIWLYSEVEINKQDWEISSYFSWKWILVGDIWCRMKQ